MTPSELEAQLKDALETLESGTLYDVLGVSSEANEPEIRDAFRERAKIFHVDSYPGVDLGEFRAPMQRVFGEMSRAHATLTDRDARGEYDASLELAEKGVPTDVRTIFMADQAFRAGKRLVERNSFKEALKQLELACDLNPTEPDYWAYRHWSEFGLLPTDADGQPLSHASANQIQAQLKAIAEEHERCVPARVFLGHIHRVEGETKEASRYYKQALRLDPDNHAARSNMRIMDKRAEKKPSLFDRLFGKK